ncbi:uncharacterized protein EI90DRAFT_1681496 [Cantharellus anzutake]|uniref:uncharacterized protein n=1 Tax=Cantharellus anzutake TaxID=1750568 RepID=UPI0019072C21|nr:uncharacterized protein EI90DRAFT_1681496 [Cantharellus anzutake]KAF8327769.1 hypothetical protein EI90DRAFT_1681496 [Cantharellus anzutake]
MSSLVSTGPRRGAVMTEHTFHAMADSQQPPSFAVSDIYHALNDESAGLAFLKDAEVSDVICYHSEGSGSHYYLMLNVRLPQQTGAHNVVCARAERVPGTQERAFFGIVRRAPAACDNIKFSYSAPVIRGPGDDLIMMLRCNSVRLIQAVYLFGIIHTHSQEYHATSLNSSWFAAASVFCVI